MGATVALHGKGDMSGAVCKDCRRERRYARTLCSRHWRAFRAWLDEKGLLAAWALGTHEYRLGLLRSWRRAEREASPMTGKAT